MHSTTPARTTMQCTAMIPAIRKNDALTVSKGGGSSMACHQESTQAEPFQNLTGLRAHALPVHTLVGLVTQALPVHTLRSPSAGASTSSSVMRTPHGLPFCVELQRCERSPVAPAVARNSAAP